MAPNKTFQRVKGPTEFLTNQIKLDTDAVKLIRRIRKEII